MHPWASAIWRSRLRDLEQGSVQLDPHESLGSHEPHALDLQGEHVSFMRCRQQKQITKLSAHSSQRSLPASQTRRKESHISWRRQDLPQAKFKRASDRGSHTLRVPPHQRSSGQLLECPWLEHVLRALPMPALNMTELCEIESDDWIRLHEIPDQS